MIYLIIIVVWLMIGMLCLFYVRSNDRYGHIIKLAETKSTTRELILYYIMMAALWPIYMYMVLK